MGPSLSVESTWWREGYRLVAGVDEAGRGALFGPVVAAAVILPPDFDLGCLPGLADSKLIGPQVRAELLIRIASTAVAVGVAAASAAIVDQIGLQRANLLAMQRALENLSPAPEIVLIDGLGPGPASYRVCAMIGADRLCASVSAASIVAKVTRDRLVTELAQAFPGYGLDRHKGYGTTAHLECLATLGPTPLHRFSFSPVAAAAADHRGRRG